jgi:8-oxo-dGTP diphosphatase
MVRHVHHGRDYWTLPGGGVEGAETLREAVVREVLEETGLNVRVGRFLYDETYALGTNYCFEALETEEGQEIHLGADPEDVDRLPEDRILQAVAWRTLKEVEEDCMVEQVLKMLKQMCEEE